MFERISQGQNKTNEDLLALEVASVSRFFPLGCLIYKVTNKIRTIQGPILGIRLPLRAPILWFDMSYENMEFRIPVKHPIRPSGTSQTS